MRGRRPGSDPSYLLAKILVAFCMAWVLALVLIGMYALARLATS